MSTIPLKGLGQPLKAWLDGLEGTAQDTSYGLAQHDEVALRLLQEGGDTCGHLLPKPEGNK